MNEIQLFLVLRPISFYCIFIYIVLYYIYFRLDLFCIRQFFVGNLTSNELKKSLGKLDKKVATLISESSHVIQHSMGMELIVCVRGRGLRCRN